MERGGVESFGEVGVLSCASSRPFSGSLCLLAQVMKYQKSLTVEQRWSNFFHAVGQFRRNFSTGPTEATNLEYVLKKTKIVSAHTSVFILHLTKILTSQKYAEWQYKITVLCAILRTWHYVAVRSSIRTSRVF